MEISLLNGPFRRDRLGRVRRLGLKVLGFLAMLQYPESACGVSLAVATLHADHCRNLRLVHSCSRALRVTSERLWGVSSLAYWAAWQASPCRVLVILLHEAVCADLWRCCFSQFPHMFGDLAAEGLWMAFVAKSSSSKVRATAAPNSDSAP